MEKVIPNEFKKNSKVVKFKVTMMLSLKGKKYNIGDEIKPYEIGRDLFDNLQTKGVVVVSN